MLGKRAVAQRIKLKSNSKAFNMVLDNIKTPFLILLGVTMVLWLCFKNELSLCWSMMSHAEVLMEEFIYIGFALKHVRKKKRKRSKLAKW